MSKVPSFFYHYITHLKYLSRVTNTNGHDIVISKNNSSIFAKTQYLTTNGKLLFEWQSLSFWHIYSKTFTIPELSWIELKIEYAVSFKKSSFRNRIFNTSVWTWPETTPAPLSWTSWEDCRSIVTCVNFMISKLKF